MTYTNLSFNPGNTGYLPTSFPSSEKNEKNDTMYVDKNNLVKVEEIFKQREPLRKMSTADKIIFCTGVIIAVIGFGIGMGMPILTFSGTLALGGSLPPKILVLSLMVGVGASIISVGCALAMIKDMHEKYNEKEKDFLNSIATRSLKSLYYDPEYSDYNHRSKERCDDNYQELENRGLINKEQYDKLKALFQEYDNFETTYYFNRIELEQRGFDYHKQAIKLEQKFAAFRNAFIEDIYKKFTPPPSYC